MSAIEILQLLFAVTAVIVILSIIIVILGGKDVEYHIALPWPFRRSSIVSWKLDLGPLTRGSRLRKLVALSILAVFLIALVFAVGPVPAFLRYGSHASPRSDPPSHATSTVPAEPVGNWCTMAAHSPKEWTPAAFTVPPGITGDDPRVLKIWYHLDRSQAKLSVQVVADIVTPAGFIDTARLWSVHRNVKQVVGDAYWPQKEFAEYADNKCWRTVPSALGAAAYENAGYSWPYAIVKAYPTADAAFTKYLHEQQGKSMNDKQSGISSANYGKLPVSDVALFFVNTGSDTASPPTAP